MSELRMNIKKDLSWIDIVKAAFYDEYKHTIITILYNYDWLHLYQQIFEWIKLNQNFYFNIHIPQK